MENSSCYYLKRKNIILFLNNLFKLKAHNIIIIIIYTIPNHKKNYFP